MERHWLESFSPAVLVAAKRTPLLTRRSLRAQNRIHVVESHSRRIKGTQGKCASDVSQVVLIGVVIMIVAFHIAGTSSARPLSRTNNLVTRKTHNERSHG
jgi:hypothetical protein|eukprot:COSAG02_NODE_9122_length_2323_cov_1.747302_3_plen_100_part_00